MNINIDISGYAKPKRGDILQTNIGNKRERTFIVLRSRLLRSRPKGLPRYKLWAERWWQIEPEMRLRLFESAERNGGQGVITFYRYPPKKKKTFEQHMRRDGYFL